MEKLSHGKRVRDDSAEFDFEYESKFGSSTKVKRIKEDLLSLLDDSDPVSDPASQDLDSVIRSFEEEISGSRTGSGSCSSPVPEPVNFVDLTSDSGDLLPELGEFFGYDQLGTLANDSDSLQIRGTDGTELVSESLGIGELWDFQNELTSYDSLGFGLGDGNSHGDEYVALGGIFDYSDVNIAWQPDTLPPL